MCKGPGGRRGLGTPRELGGGRTKRGLVSPGAGNGVRQQRVQDEADLGLYLEASMESH